jgi:hypothetical protein
LQVASTRRNIIAVHPVTGWWKVKAVKEPEKLCARFALIVEIDAGNTEADLYSEVQTAVESLNIVTTTV